MHFRSPQLSQREHPFKSPPPQHRPAPTISHPLPSQTTTKWATATPPNRPQRPCTTPYPVLPPRLRRHERLKREVNNLVIVISTLPIFDAGAGGGEDDEGDVWGCVGGLAWGDGEVCAGGVLRGEMLVGKGRDGGCRCFRERIVGWEGSGYCGGRYCLKWLDSNGATAVDGFRGKGLSCMTSP